MDWREVTIYTTTEGIGPVEALLEDNGVEAVSYTHLTLPTT